MHQGQTKNSPQHYYGYHVLYQSHLPFSCSEQLYIPRTNILPMTLHSPLSFVWWYELHECLSSGTICGSHHNVYAIGQYVISFKKVHNLSLASIVGQPSHLNAHMFRRVSQAWKPSHAPQPSCLHSCYIHPSQTLDSKGSHHARDLKSHKPTITRTLDHMLTLLLTHRPCHSSSSSTNYPPCQWKTYLHTQITHFVLTWPTPNWENPPTPENIPYILCCTAVIISPFVLRNSSTYRWSNHQKHLSQVCHCHQPTYTYPQTSPSQKLPGNLVTSDIHGAIKLWRANSPSPLVLCAIA